MAGARKGTRWRRAASPASLARQRARERVIAPVSRKVFLPAHQVRPCDPASELGIDVAGGGETEFVHVIARRVGHDLREPRMEHRPVEHEMTAEPVVPCAHDHDIRT